MTLAEFGQMLDDGLPISVGHYYAIKENPPYVIWHEFGDSRLHADDAEAERKYYAQVELYTTTEYDPLDDAVRAIFDQNEIAYQYTADYDPEEKTIRHIYTCEVV